MCTYPVYALQLPTSGLLSTFVSTMPSPRRPPLLQAFAPPFMSAARRLPNPPVARRPRNLLAYIATDSRLPDTDLPPAPTRIQLARLRRHLLRMSSASPKPASDFPNLPKPPASPTAPARRPRQYSEEERRARSERLRAKWQDPEWRAAMLAKRKEPAVLSRSRESARKLWKDPEHRAKQRAARLGRPAPNKGVSASASTRLRMSVARKGVPRTEETRKRMSAAKRNRPEGDEWPRLISESKKGKTREYFQMRREFRALYKDLKLWSDSYRTTHGRLPSPKTYESTVAPMMLFRIKRYLVLRDALGDDDPEIKREIIARS